MERAVVEQAVTEIFRSVQDIEGGGVKVRGRDQEETSLRQHVITDNSNKAEIEESLLPPGD